MFSTLFVPLLLARYNPGDLAVAEQPPVEGPVIVTTGEGVVKLAPDRVWVTIAAESRAKSPREAQRANADAMKAVLDKLKALGPSRRCDPHVWLRSAAGVRLRQRQADAARIRRA